VKPGFSIDKKAHGQLTANLLLMIHCCKCNVICKTV